jgi:hypothetical protein
MPMRRRDLLLAALAPSQPLNLRDVAAVHVAIAEKDKGRRKIWGRIGGTPPEHESAAALAAQLKPFLPKVDLEPFPFQAHRALEWEVKLDGKPVETAMPAPFEARFPETVTAPVEPIEPDGNWNKTAAKWAFVSSRATTSTAFNIVREKLLYQRAVEHGAAGLMFSLPTPRTSRWKSVVPVDKPYAVKDERYPNGIRPIPCFSVDAIDGESIAAAGAKLSATIRYDAAAEHEGRNVVGFLPGSSAFAVAVMCHIDSFFAGACDNASGMAAMVGIAESLSRLPPSARQPDFYFLGLSAHHDEAAGMRAWVARDPQRFARIRQLFLLEHVDALDSEEGRQAGWPTSLNNNRTAYLGSDGWAEVRAQLPDLVRQSGAMTVPPKMQDACIADLFVTCGRVKSFCLMNTPPFYHTDHDTLDRISGAGIRNAANLHLMLFKKLKLIS